MYFFEAIVHDLVHVGRSDVVHCQPTAETVEHFTAQNIRLTHWTNYNKKQDNLVRSGIADLCCCHLQQSEATVCFGWRMETGHPSSPFRVLPARPGPPSGTTCTHVYLLNGIQNPLNNLRRVHNCNRQTDRAHYGEMCSHSQNPVQWHESA